MSKIACEGSRSHILGLVLDAIQLLHFAWAGPNEMAQQAWPYNHTLSLFHLVQLVISVDIQSQVHLVLITTRFPNHTVIRSWW